MPGGIGSIPPQSRKPKRSRTLGCSLTDSATVTEIFYHLSHWRVFYVASTRQLYFSAIEHSPVLPLINRLCARHALGFQLETLYLDPHNYLFGGYRVELPAVITKPLLVALRLEGVMVSQRLETMAQEPDCPV